MRINNIKLPIRPNITSMRPKIHLNFRLAAIIYVIEKTSVQFLNCWPIEFVSSTTFLYSLSTKQIEN